MSSVDAYTAAEAGRVLRVSPKRVHQFAEEDRLEVVGRSPLRVSQISVLQLQQERNKAADEQPAGSEGQPRRAGASRRSPHAHTPSAELVPLLTSAFDRVQAADARTLEEHGRRMTAEAEASFLREALHEARAAATSAQQELTHARSELLRLAVVEAEVERLRSELKAVKSEGEASLSSKDPREGPVGGPEGEPSEAHTEEVVRLREELAAAHAREQAQREAWEPALQAAAQGREQIARTLEKVEAQKRESDEVHRIQREQLEASRQASLSPADPPAGWIGRLFGRR